MCASLQLTYEHLCQGTYHKENIVVRCEIIRNLIMLSSIKHFSGGLKIVKYWEIQSNYEELETLHNVAPFAGMRDGD
jgi:hypothetical protein